MPSYLYNNINNLRNSYTIQLIYKVIYELFLVMILFGFYYFAQSLKQQIEKTKEVPKTEVEWLKLTWSIDILLTLIYL